MKIESSGFSLVGAASRGRRSQWRRLAAALLSRLEAPPTTAILQPSRPGASPTRIERLLWERHLATAGANGAGWLPRFIEAGSLSHNSHTSIIEAGSLSRTNRAPFVGAASCRDFIEAGSLSHNSHTSIIEAGSLSRMNRAPFVGAASRGRRSQWRRLAAAILSRLEASPATAILQPSRPEPLPHESSAFCGSGILPRFYRGWKPLPRQPYFNHRGREPLPSACRGLESEALFSRFPAVSLNT